MLYCFSKYSTLRSIHFCIHLNQLSKHFCHCDWGISKHAFWTHQALLQMSKNVDLSFYFLRTGIKRSHSVPSQDYTADDSSNRCFECSKMQLFEPSVKSDPSSAIGFPDFLEDNWQTNDCVPLRINYSALF